METRSCDILRTGSLNLERVQNAPTSIRSLAVIARRHLRGLEWHVVTQECI
jgi:hypothetical protein